MSDASSDLLGVDGCKAGWFAVRREAATGAITARVFEQFAQLLQWASPSALIAVDMPIGLSSDAMPRGCDQAARRLLGASRRASVFSAPNRQALDARDYVHACELSRLHSGRAMSRQSYFLMAKIAEVDRARQAQAHGSARIFEVHPELAFMQMRVAQWDKSQGELPAGGLAERKKDAAGYQLRLQLLQAVFGSAVQCVLQQRVASQAGRDDVLDAFAALWTASRIASGTAVVLPDTPRADVMGIPMEIRY